ncbi:large subunit ribosomal protein L17 [Olivibacter domesticus]|uniref:Large ribosomal subunit protein bL17 n=1 Tax=Olivibacter domesticus TaxID=407022 RepID=A0A1H7V2E4_OLID1|nr:large subunit ribosomal protein L17 [Olivibacter domesticus]
MRHGKKINHLGRTDSHRKALLSNMAVSLIKHKRITTTLAKARALRSYVEPLITKSKNDTTHSRRTVFSYVKDKEAVTILFREISEKVANRPGGYTRIVKLANRAGDNAEVALIELVDYNEIYAKGEAKVEKKTTRRRSGKKKTEAIAVEATDKVEADKVETDKVETKAKASGTKKAAKGDDLTIIEGVGPKIAEVFVAAGVVSFSDVAAKTAEELKAILSEAGDQFNTAVTDTWPEQAKLAADGKLDELKKWQDELDGGKEADEETKED